MSSHLVMAYKLRQWARGDYIHGYAARIHVEEGRIVLEDRRLPIVQFRNGVAGAAAVPLGNLEICTEGECGWAVWAVQERVDWWEAKLAG